MKYILLFASFLFITSACSVSEQTESVIVLDLSQNIPEKEIILEIESVNYIPLETTDKVLMGDLHRIKYISENKIIICNALIGDIFVFNSEGRIISQFNYIREKDGTGYNRITELVYDEANKEIFVLDRSTLCLAQVYSEEGEYKRTLHFPDRTTFSPVFDFDNETLLAYDADYLIYKSNLTASITFGFSKIDSINSINNKQPYVFLSKKDGSIVSNLDIYLPERISTVHVNQAKKSFSTTPTQKIIKYGVDFLLTDIASDTVYLLSQDKILTPVFVRKPSVQLMQPQTILNMQLITDKFLYMKKHVFDTENGFGGEFEELVYDKQDNRMYRVKQFKVADPSGEIPFDWKVLGGFTAFNEGYFQKKNMIVRRLSADQLKEDLETGRLKGRLKDIASKMDEEDNPVVEIIQLR
ncbi:MAG: 6-bladed beta-propeller [Bacteroidales bacterium]|jgi:hypothetical protein|nr:6-bladed beta-propeller [Bacteroidales bacterium]